MTNESDELKPCPFCGKDPSRYGGIDPTVACLEDSCFDQMEPWSEDRWQNAHCWKLLDEKNGEIRTAHDVVQMRDKQISELVSALEYYAGLSQIKDSAASNALAKLSSEEKK